MSQVQIQPGGNRGVPAGTRVATDQSSILGDGSSENPLRAGAGGVLLKVDVNSIGAVHLGTPVVAIGAPSTPGAVCTVTKASGINAQSAAICLGLIVAFNEDGTCQVQTSGIVTLTVAEWSVIASPSGGLNASEAYYLDAPGLLNDVAPASPGNWASQVGVAISPEQLLLSCPSVPLAVT